jgi:hypothetical protein
VGTLSQKNAAHRAQTLAFIRSEVKISTQAEPIGHPVVGHMGIIVIDAIIEIVYMNIRWPPIATLGARCRLNNGIDYER